MIKDLISNAHSHDSLHPNFHTIFEILQALNLDAMEDGHIELDGEYVYIDVETVAGKSECEARLASHRRYIDIQVPLSGNERFGVKPTPECESVSQPYDETNDIEYYADCPTRYEDLAPGEFIIFFPEDAHAQPITPNPRHRKLTVKISVEPNRERPVL